MRPSQVEEMLAVLWALLCVGLIHIRAHRFWRWFAGFNAATCFACAILQLIKSRL